MPISNARNTLESQQAISELTQSTERLKSLLEFWRLSLRRGRTGPTGQAIDSLRRQLTDLHFSIQRRWSSPREYLANSGPPSHSKTSLRSIQECCSDLDDMHRRLDRRDTILQRALFLYNVGFPSHTEIETWAQKVKDYTQSLAVSNPTIGQDPVIQQARQAEGAYAVYQSTKDIPALDRAILTMKAAVANAPAKHRDRGCMLNNLAVWTAQRARSVEAGATEHVNNKALKESIRFSLDAVKATSMNDERWSVHRYNLRDFLLEWQMNTHTATEENRAKTGFHSNAISSFYKPLPFGSLRLLRPVKGASLSFSLEQHTLSEAPLYIALSYTWSTDDYRFDTSETQHNILVNQCEFDVQENLFDALEHIWDDVIREGCLLWVDSVCINQSDLEERACQVPFMSKIFESSQVVYVWLGLPLFRQEVEYALALMRSFTDNDVAHRREYGDVLADTQIRRLNMRTGDFFPRMNKPGTIAAWEGLYHLFNRQVWNRTWVRQEITTKRPTICFCGDLAFPLDYVVSIVHRATSHEEHPDFDPELSKWLGQRSPISEITAIRHKRRNNSGEQVWPLIEIMREFRSTQCSDPRDKVYAALGLTEDVTEPQIVKDYSIDVAVLYTRLACWALDQGYGLAFLGLVHGLASIPDADLALPGLPSWVPDWRYGTVMPLGPIKHVSASPRDKQNRLYDPCPGHTAKFNVFDNMLHVTGVVFDEVRTITTSLRTSTTPLITKDVERMRTHFLGHWKPALKADGAQFLDIAFDRTIVADTQCRFESDGWQDYRNGKFDWDLLEITLGQSNQTEWEKRSELLEAAFSASAGREAGITSLGNLRLLPGGTMVGDCIAVFHGGPCLYVLRPQATSGHYMFVGECYVDEMMDGQAMTMVEELGLVAQEVVLV